MEIKNNDLSLLISINDDIATIKDTPKLFQSIFKKLHDCYGMIIFGIALFDKSKEKLAFIIAQIEEQKSIAESFIWLKTFSVNWIPFELDITNPQITNVGVEYFQLMETFQKQQPSLEEVLNNLHIETLVLIPMKTGGDLIGYLIFSPEQHSLNTNEWENLIIISNLIASTINNAIAFEELQQKENEKAMQIRLLVNLLTIKGKDELYRQLASEINKLIPCEYIIISAEQQDKHVSKTYSLSKDANDNFKISASNRNLPSSVLSIKSKFVEKNNLKYLELSGNDFNILCEQLPHIKQLRTRNSINSLLALRYSYENLGELYLMLGRSEPFSTAKGKGKTELIFSQDKNSFFSNKEIKLGIELLPQLALMLTNLYAFEEIRILTQKLEQEKNYFLDEINSTNSFQEIIGNSQPLINALNKVRQVAPLNATVLILGETGTGKELLAKAVHNLSQRKDNAFITVNCAALPTQLIESELFGHEKGSFTGAINQKIGKFEVANQGTIFLDEIGELPLEIQAKLLRVLQEKEFERLGGKTTIFSDVRIIAATNRDLEKEVEHGKFRADLFFRLNVFPIVVPPLRERKEDIPILVKAFVDKYSKKVGRETKSIKRNDLEMLVKYNWPGNIRELEHFIERAIIISEGSTLNFEKLLDGNLQNEERSWEVFKTLVETEKEHIINALKIANGKITGDKSAAQLLGINGKTLGSKMKKFGIKREVVYSIPNK